MQRAFDLAPVEPAVGQLGVGMGADIVGRKHLAVEVVEGDLLPGDDDAKHIAGTEIAAGGGLDPAGVIVAHAAPLSLKPDGIFSLVRARPWAGHPRVTGTALPSVSWMAGPSPAKSVIKSVSRPL